MAAREWDIQCTRIATDYLAEVDKALAASGKSESERSGIVDDLHAQIHAMVEEASPEGPTPRKV